MLQDKFNGVRSKGFRGASGGEHFISVEADGGLGLAAQIAQVEQRYAATRAALGLADETAVFRRIFVSDMINQAARIRESALFARRTDSPVAVSLVQQPPAVRRQDRASRLSPRRFRAGQAAPLRSTICWSRTMAGAICGRPGCAPARTTTPFASPSKQTRAVFGDLIGTLAGQGATLRDNCVRTWIYIKDVDVFYRGMVESRGAMFAEQGLTGDTPFHRQHRHRGRLRASLRPRRDGRLFQPRSRTAADLLPQRLRSAVRDQGLQRPISNAARASPMPTARIISSRARRASTRHGQVVHPGDVLRQLDARAGQCRGAAASARRGLADLMHLIVYLRDPADFARIDGYLAERFPDLPIIIVAGRGLPAANGWSRSRASPSPRT